MSEAIKEDEDKNLYNMAARFQEGQGSFRAMVQRAAILDVITDDNCSSFGLTTASFKLAVDNEQQKMGQGVRNICALRITEELAETGRVNVLELNS